MSSPRLQRLLDKETRPYFPELKRRSISISYETNPIGGRSWLYTTRIIRLNKKTYQIKVNAKLKKAKDIVLIGGIGHELGHISLDDRLNKKTYSVATKIYNRSKIYRDIEEKYVDLQLIIKGLKNPLEAFDTFIFKKFNTKSAGLTDIQINKIVSAYYGKPYKGKGLKLLQ